MKGKKCGLPREVLQTKLTDDVTTRSNNELQEVSRRHSSNCPLSCEGLNFSEELLRKTMQARNDRQPNKKGYLEKIGTECQQYQEVSMSAMNIEANNFHIENTKDLLEQICDYDNMKQACQKVVANGGSSGIDNMNVYQLDSWLDKNYETLKSRLLTKKYKPKPVKRVQIPKKEKGKVRLLGIPTVVDRMIQQAMVQVLSPIYDMQFSQNSFGFRPNKSAHDALRKVKAYADEGNRWVASIDLEKFFDIVNQSKLIQLLSNTIKDGKVISLIHRYLMAGVMVDGVCIASRQGTPQGGPLSPLLANIILNELDKELEKRGHAFVRYADDCMILKASKKAATRCMESISTFIEKKLFLKVNKEKSYVAYITDSVKYLGYGFYMYDKELRFRVHPKSTEILKDKIRFVMSRSNGWSRDYRRYRLRCLVYGWVNYFKLANMKSMLGRIDEWCRRKIRCLYWKCWKRIRTRYKELTKLGVSKEKAYMWANTRKSYWRVAGSHILATTLTNKKLKEKDWICFSDIYERVSMVN